MRLAVLTVHLMLPACASLKDKRSQIKPLLSRLHREFNISAAEIDLLDIWREAVLACVVVSNSAVHNQQVMEQVTRFIEQHWPDLYIVDQSIEVIA